MPPIDFAIQVEMTSDWHVGSGAGRSVLVDRTVRRDEYGLPYLPAKTLAGIWRDACERVAAALDQDTGSSAWAQLLDELFGFPGSREAAGLTVRSAFLTGTLREQLRHRNPEMDALRSAMTFLKQSTAVDSRSGHARDRSLRCIEYARGGAPLEAMARVVFPENEERRSAAEALLVAGARMVESLGAGRRRGLGACILQLGAPLMKVSEAREWLRNAPRLTGMARPDSLPARAVGSAEASEVGSTPGAWVDIPLQIRIVSPTVIARQVIGNVTESLDFIPGTSFLPLIARALEDGGLDPLKQFSEGSIRVLRGTPMLEGSRSRPVPFWLWQRRGAGAGTSVEYVDRRADGQNQAPGEKPVRSGWVPASGLPDGTWVLQVPTIFTTHATIEDRAQRPTEEVGGVYTYQAIAPGNAFGSIIRMRKGLYQSLVRRDPDWTQTLKACSSLGRSTGDEYGEVEVLAGEPRDAGSLRQPLKPGDQVTISCLSDVLLPPASGPKDPGLSAEGLCWALAARLPGTGFVPTPGSTYLRIRRLESWHRRWGLPRPSMVAIAAGSCATLELEKGTVEEGGLEEVVLSGLGERRAEGFGEIVLERHRSTDLEDRT
jgi:CRISPR-associated protein Csx10